MFIIKENKVVSVPNSQEKYIQTPVPCMMEDFSSIHHRVRWISLEMTGFLQNPASCFKLLTSYLILIHLDSPRSTIEEDLLFHRQILGGKRNNSAARRSARKCHTISSHIHFYAVPTSRSGSSAPSYVFDLIIIITIIKRWNHFSAQSWCIVPGDSWACSSWISSKSKCSSSNCDRMASAISCHTTNRHLQEGIMKYWGDLVCETFRFHEMFLWLIAKSWVYNEKES